jgi:hypothetical protein
MKPFASWLLRITVGALFVVAGALKLRDPAAFALEVVNYRLLSSLAPVIAVVLPPMEVVLGAALITAPVAWRRAAALALLVLLGVFTVAVTLAVARGINVDCGCFGPGAGRVTWLTVLRDLALLAATGAALALTPAPPRATSPR